MQAIGARSQLLTFDSYWIRKRNRSVLIGAGTPHLIVRNKASPDFTVLYEWPGIVNCNIRNANTLRYAGLLAWPRQVENRLSPERGQARQHYHN